MDGILDLSLSWRSRSRSNHESTKFQKARKGISSDFVFSPFRDFVMKILRIQFILSIHDKQTFAGL